jgi:Right handed beta helix region
MNRPTRALVTATFSLLSVLSAHAANSKISSLPFTITAPGTYALAGNLSYTSGSSFGAISITGPIEGPVIVDLKGFTLTSDVADSKACILIRDGTGTYPTTVRNGSITTFANGINDFEVSNITIKNVVFNRNGTGVVFGQFVGSSTVSNCTFNSCSNLGIYDYVSPGGNSFSNNTFVNTTALDIYSYCCSTPLVLDRCQFAAPPATSLITSAMTPQVATKFASISISSLPFSITAPGTYVLTGNLSYIGGGNSSAINITEPIGGPVMVDLRGFTITSDGNSTGVSISGSTGLYPITIRNGTIKKFSNGVLTNFASNDSESNISVKNIIFEENILGVGFKFVNLSTVANCTFKDMSPYGISDYQSIGGNNYINNMFVGSGLALYVQSQFQTYGGTPLVLDRCDFAAPPSN